MKKAALQKLVGNLVKLDPAAVSVNGKRLDDGWKVTQVTGIAVELDNERTGATVTIGHDAVYCFWLDAARSTETQTFGILQLHSQVTLMADGGVTVKPLPPPKTAGGAVPVERFHPLVLVDGDVERHYSWQGRDPVHLSREERPKQLMALYEPLCHLLRVETGREPEFSLPSDLRGDPVYELSPDYRARWPLLGGAGGEAGSALLVLTDIPARFANGDEILSYGRPCSCGRGHAKLKMSRHLIVQRMAENKLRLFCYICNSTPELSAEEKAELKRAL